MSHKNTSSIKSMILVMFSISFLTGCDAILKPAVDWYVGIISEKVSNTVATETKCPRNVSLIAKQLIRIKKSSDEKMSKINLVSEKDDKTLIEIYQNYESALTKVELPKDDAEKMYPDLLKNRIKEETALIEKEYFTSISNSIPKLLESCGKTISEYAKLCTSYKEKNFEAYIDCENFYEKRIFLTMIKQSPSFPDLVEAERKMIDASLIETFEDNLKKLAAAQDAEAKEKSKPELSQVK